MSNEGSLDRISPVHWNAVFGDLPIKYNLLVLWMNFAVEAEAPLVVMVLVELLAIVFPTWVILAFMYRERE